MAGGRISSPVVAEEFAAVTAKQPLGASQIVVD